MKITMANTTTTDLIEKINLQTPVTINLVPLGFAWFWKCIESKPFHTPQMALINWINYVCQSYEEVLIELLEKDDDFEEDDPSDDRPDSYYEVIET